MGLAAGPSARVMSAAVVTWPIGPKPGQCVTLMGHGRRDVLDQPPPPPTSGLTAAGNAGNSASNIIK